MDNNLKIENAVIEGTMLGYEDHGIMTCMLYLEREVGHQGFGGYSLDTWIEEKKKRQDVNGYGLEFVRQILDIVGVETWDNLKGKHIRIATDGNWNSPIQGIGNIIKDKWFYPKAFFDDYENNDSK